MSKNEAGDSPAAVCNEGALRDSGAVDGVADADTTHDGGAVTLNVCFSSISCSSGHLCRW